MTTPIAPSAIPQFGTPPSTQDPANFDVRMDDTLSKLVAFVDATNAAADDTYQNAQSAFENATASASDVVLTAASEVAAEAALADTIIAKDAAQAAALEADESSDSAIAAKILAQAAATQVDVSGALAGLPPKAGSALKVVRVNAAGDAFEYFALPAVERLHVLSASAATKNAVTAMLPMFDFKAAALGTTAATGVVWAGSQFIIAGAVNQSNCDTSPDGKTWTQRAVGAAYRAILNNGANVIAAPFNAGQVGRKSSDSGVTWSDTGSSPVNLAIGYRAYATSGKFISVNGTSAGVTSDNGATWTAAQTMPHTSQGVFPAGSNFVSYTTSSGTYYTSSTGLTGSWTSRTFPDSIAASTLREDGAGGLVLVSTTTSKNLWHTVDGITWTDLGFSQDSLKYGGLADATNNTAVFVCPVRINGNWVLFNGSTAGAGGAGAMVKYAGNTWVPMFVDAGGLANTSAVNLLVATNNVGVTIVKDPAANATVHVINTASTKCVGNFI